MSTVFHKKSGFIIGILPVLFLVLYLSRGIISFLLVAFFLAYAINPWVEFFQKKGARRDWAILTVYLILFLVGTLVFLLIVPRLIRDLTQLLQNMPVFVREFHQMSVRLSHTFNSWKLPFNLQSIMDELSVRGEVVLRNLLNQLGKALINILSWSFFLLLTPLLAYYFSRDYPDIKRKVNQWLAKHLGNHWTQTFLKIDAVFRLYIRGQLLDTLAVAILLGLGLNFLGFDAAILLGFIAAIFNLIPYFGPILGAIPVIIFALLKSPLLVLYVILLFLVVNQLEAFFLAPRIIGNQLRLHPITIIYFILVGGKIGGLLGMILAVPLGAILLIIIKSIYEICFGLVQSEPQIE